MLSRRYVDFAVYLIVRLAICIVQALPVDTGAALARWFAWLFGRVLKLRRRVIYENLAHAFPEMTEPDRKRLTLAMWEHLFILVLEVAHTPRKIHETNWRDFVELDGEAELVRALISERPLLVLSGHFGNFEVGGYVLGVLGFSMHTVARTLDNPYLDRFLATFRGGTGQRLIPKQGGYDQIEHVMGSGGIMTLLVDQAAGPKGCWVNFFNRPASAHKAIALLALEHQAPMCVCSSQRLGRPMRFRLTQHVMLDPRESRPETRGVREITQWFTSELERIIREAPQQYWWIHRRWKDTRPKRAAKEKAA